MTSLNITIDLKDILAFWMFNALITKQIYSHGRGSLNGINSRVVGKFITNGNKHALQILALNIPREVNTLPSGLLARAQVFTSAGTQASLGRA